MARVSLTKGHGLRALERERELRFLPFNYPQVPKLISQKSWYFYGPKWGNFSPPRLSKMTFLAHLGSIFLSLMRTKDGARYQKIKQLAYFWSRLVPQNSQTKIKRKPKLPQKAYCLPCEFYLQKATLAAKR